MENKWASFGNDYYLKDIGNQQDVLPVSIYKLMENSNREIYVSRLQNKFEFPYKVYGVEDKFVQRVKKTFDYTKGNLGILLNGVKGTGKTVTGELICNALNLPVIIISKKMNETVNYINSIQQDCIIFFDEYEKTYPEHDHSVLVVMDGVLTNEYRKVFLLTTNSMRVESNLVQRPGRIRYLKTFKDLSLDTIMDIVDDRLIYKEFREEIIKFVSGLEIVTIDIVKSIVEEVNIHEDGPVSFGSIFNIKSVETKFDIFTINAKGEETKINAKATITPIKITEESIGKHFCINDHDYKGVIRAVIENDTFVVEDYDDEGKPLLTTYTIRPSHFLHSSFIDYVF